MIDGYVSFRMSFFPRHHCFFFFFFSRNLKYRLSLLNVVQRTIKRLAIRDYPRIPTYGQDSGRHRPTIDRRCIALKKKKKDVFLAAAYRGVPLSTSSSPTYSYVFTYVTTRLSRSPVLFVRRVARGIEGERCGPKKKKRRRAIYHRRAMAVNPTLFLSPFFLSNHAARFHETFFWPSIIDLYRVISSNDFLNSFPFFFLFE